MTNKKQVFLSLETARKMYKDISDKTILKENFNNHSTILFLLDNFTKEELEAKELPKSWEELEIIKGYYISSSSKVTELDEEIHEISTDSENKSVFPTKELAEASLALSQLLQLRDVYNGNWKVDLNHRPNDTRYYIFNRNNIATKDFAQHSNINYVLSFNKINIRNEFYNNFIELIETALPLL